MTKKLLVIDTNVLLYDKHAIHSFPNNHIVIPLGVLKELDKFKNEPGIIGESARYCNRYLDGLRSDGNLSEGVYVEDSNQTVQIAFCGPQIADRPDLNPLHVDDQIIMIATHLLQSSVDINVKVITKDINLRVRCDVENINAEDYYKDYKEYIDNEYYMGQATLELIDSDIDEFFERKSIDLRELGFDDEDDELYDNQLIVGKAGTRTFIGKKFHDEIVQLNTNALGEIQGKNKEQKFAIDVLNDPEIKLVTITGFAGTGKTFLTLAAGLKGLQKGDYERIIITRTIQSVGREMGFLPGDMHEKMMPWVQPIFDNFRNIRQDVTELNKLVQSGIMELAPLAYMRGRTFNDCYIIVDEAQNSSIHELKTLITRVGKNSKIVLLGDIEQIDTPYLNKRSNGLSIIVEKFKSSDLASHIELTSGQRSKLASLASEIL